MDKAKTARLALLLQFCCSTKGPQFHCSNRAKNCPNGSAAAPLPQGQPDLFSWCSAVALLQQKKLNRKPPLLPERHSDSPCCSQGGRPMPPRAWQQGSASCTHRQGHLAARGFQTSVVLSHTRLQRSPKQWTQSLARRLPGCSSNSKADLQDTRQRSVVHHTHQQALQLLAGLDGSHTMLHLQVPPHSREYVLPAGRLG